MTKRILLSILTALALSAVFLGVVDTRPVSAGLGFPSFKDSAAATATVISVATIGSQIGVHVVDSDLTGSSTQVTVKSTSDPTGFIVTLSKIAEGRYSALLKIATSTAPTTTPPKLKAASGDTVTVNYVDASPAITTSASISVVSSLDADLILTKRHSRHLATAGEGLTYTLTITNDGPADATNVSLTDTLPSVVTFLAAIPSQGSCDESGKTVVCNLGGLAKDATATVTIGVNVPLSTPDGTELTNVATATANEGDPNTGNNTDMVVTTVIRPADLSVTKSDSPDPVAVGQNLTYTIVVTNNGPFEAPGVMVADPIGISTFVSATPNQGSCDESNRTVSCTLGTIASLAGSTVTIVVTPTQTGLLGNAVSVTADSIDPSLSDNSATANTTVQQAGNGTVSFKNGTSTSAADLQSVTVGSQVAVHVVDADLAGATSTTVTVVSDSDPAGFTLTLNAVATDVFSGLFEIAPSTLATATPPRLRAANGGTVITRYADASPAITRADSLVVAGPVFSNLSPADGTITRASTQILSVEITDGVSGINGSSIRFLLDTNPTFGGTSIQITPSSFASITDGFRAEILLGLPQGTRYIGAKARDNLGNEAIYDADPDTAGNQGNRLTVDFTACGDLNGDGDINVLDAIIDLQIIVGLITPTETQLKVGNVVRDDTINVLDAILLLQHIVGLTEITGCGPPPITAANTSLRPQPPVPSALDERVFVPHS